MIALCRNQIWCSAAVVCAAAAVCIARPAVAQSGPNASWTWAPDAVGGYASDHIMVKLAPNARISVDHTGTVTAWTSRGKLDWRVTQTLADVGPTASARAWIGPPKDTARVKALGIDRWIKISVPPGTDTPALAQRMMVAGIGGATVQWAEIDAIGTVAGTDAPAPNDPDFTNQWGLENTGQQVNGVFGTPGADVAARAAWHVTTGGNDTMVAVLDSGVNHHQDFGDRVLPGFNVPDQTTETDDGCSNHGTHVAGVLAAEANNGTDIAGLLWNAKIIPIVVVNPCSGQSSWLADGLFLAVDNGATVANASLQYSVGTQYLHDAVLYTVGAGVPVVAAAGNTGFTGVAWPAKWEEVIAVGSIQSDNAAAGTTAVGPEVDVAAPGVQVLSTVNLAGTEYKNGTSMACPHATGVVALMQSVAPRLSIAQLRAAMEGTCVDIQDPGVDQTSGHGRINAGAAVRAARLMAGLGDFNGDGLVDGADLGTLLGSWGSCGTPCPADLNDDNVVDGADLGLLLGGWSMPE